MRGSITVLHNDREFGFILGEDGCEIYFDRAGLKGTKFEALSVGQWVDYEIQSGDWARATNVRISEKNRRNETPRPEEKITERKGRSNA